MAPLAWPSVILTKVLTRPDPRLRATSSWPGSRHPQAGRHRQVDQRVGGQRHHDDRAEEAVRPGPQRVPAEAHHEVRDRERHDHEHGPGPAAGQVGALDAPRGGGPDHGAQYGDRHREPDRVPQQRPGQRPEDQVEDVAEPGSAGLDQQEDQRQGQDRGHQAAQGEQGHGPAGATWRDLLAPVALVVAAISERSRRGHQRFSPSSRVTAGPPGGAGQSPPSRRRARRS